MPFGFSKFLTAMRSVTEIERAIHSFAANHARVSRIASRLPKTNVCFLYFAQAGGKLAT